MQLQHDKRKRFLLFLYIRPVYFVKPHIKYYINAYIHVRTCILFLSMLNALMRTSNIYTCILYIHTYILHRYIHVHVHVYVRMNVHT